MDDFFWFAVLGVAVAWSVFGVAGVGWIPERVRVRVKRLEKRLRKPYGGRDGRPDA